MPATGFVSFGTPNAEAARRLREFADLVEAGEVFVTGTTDNVRNNADDFEIRHFVMRYHHLRKPV